MLRYQDGDAGAFEVLYRRHNDALYRYLLRLSAQPATAEDLYQEVWSRIVKARKNYRPTAKFTTYLYRIAHNCFIDYLRRNRRHAADVSTESLEIEDPQQSPERDAEHAGIREQLLRALADIPVEQREAFLLHEDAGLNVDEIAVTTGVNRETAKSRLRYANKKLRTALASATRCSTQFGREHTE